MPFLRTRLRTAPKFALYVGFINRYDVVVNCAPRIRVAISPREGSAPMAGVPRSANDHVGSGWVNFPFSQATRRAIAYHFRKQYKSDALVSRLPLWRARLALCFAFSAYLAAYPFFWGIRAAPSLAFSSRTILAYSAVRFFLYIRAPFGVPISPFPSTCRRADWPLRPPYLTRGSAICEMLPPPPPPFLLLYRCRPTSVAPCLPIAYHSPAPPVSYFTIFAIL